jgi:hypothetical protein
MLYKPVTKTHLLNAMQRWRSQWEDTLFAIGEENMLCSGDAPGDRSPRDIVAHASAYERWLMEWLEADARGAQARPSALDDLDPQRRDRAAYELTRAFPLDLVLGDSWLTWERLMMALEHLSDEEISDPRRAPEFVRRRWGPGMSLGLAVACLTYEHYRQHLPALRQWICAPAHAS